VAEGGSLSIGGNGLYDGNSTTAGSGAGDGGNGQASGNGIFLQGSGNLILRVRAGDDLMFNDSISDSVGTGLAPATSFQQWNLIIAGGGGVPVDSNDPNAGMRYGTVTFGSTNAIGGDTYISGANVLVDDLGAFGNSGVVALDDGGLIVAPGLDIDRDLVVDSGGGRIGVASGNAQLSADTSGSGSIAKIGTGNLLLNGTSGHDGAWVIREGGLVIDADSRLGSSSLVLEGGSLVYGSAFNDLREVGVTTAGGTINNNGFDVTLANGFIGWDAGSTLSFTGTGTTTLTGATPGTGNTEIIQGRVEGAIASGALRVYNGATYDLDGANRSIGALGGNGSIVLGSNTLSIVLGVEDPPLDSNFAGVISGTGGVSISRNGLPAGFNPLTDIDQYRTQSLGSGNTYSGNTVVGTGAILGIADDSSIGSGQLILAGGALATGQTSSNINITLAGGGGIFGDLTFNGVISGVGTFVKYGAGTLSLTNTNTFVGNTMVVGEGSYLALANPNAIGSGNLQLTLGGGLRVLTDTTSLRPIQILDGVGVVDVGAFDVQSTGASPASPATASCARKARAGCCSPAR